MFAYQNKMPIKLHTNSIIFFYYNNFIFNLPLNINNEAAC